MEDVLSGAIVAILGILPLIVFLSRYRGGEPLLLAGAYLAHVLSAFAQVLIQSEVYGKGDIFGYAGRGVELAAALRLDFGNISVELVKLLFHDPEVTLPLFIQGTGSSTGSMAAIAGFATYLTGGGVYAGCMLISVFSFYGTMCLYEVFRQSFPEKLRTRLLIASMLVPSVAYWSSGLLKESVAMAGLGPLALGTYYLFESKLVQGALLAIFGAVVVGLVKPYILFAFVIAAGVWVYAVRTRRAGVAMLSPRAAITALVIGVGGLIVLGKIFPRYALENIAEQAAFHQEIGQTSRGDSTYVMGDGNVTSLSGQLLFAPFALITALFRPFIFEGAKPQQIVNALETSTFLFSAIGLVWKTSLRTLWRAVIEKPIILFALTFTVTLGVAVGLSTTNLGTLSRYRMPFIPFFATVLFTLWDASRAAAEQERSQRPVLAKSVLRGNLNSQSAP